jgi:heterotetrameric sarcosine oxidase gamma subunit
VDADSIGIETSAFAGLSATVGRGRGVVATERHGLGIARIAARGGQAFKVAELLHAQFGIEPPRGPRCVSRGGLRIAGIAPGTWLASREHEDDAFADSLRSVLGGHASLSDQSDAYVVLRLAGPKVRDTLAKLIPMDIHPRSFRPSDVAQTLCGQIGIVLWRLEDTAQGESTFELWAARSLAVSLHQAISRSAAEFGFVREPPHSPASARLEA